MKIYELINAAQPLKYLTGLHFTNFKMARELSILKKKVDENLVFFIEQQNKIRELYPDNPEKVKEELSLLQQTEVDDIKKIDISSTDFLKVEDIPTPEQMLLLDSLVEWK